jgi:hypothetical protein
MKADKVEYTGHYLVVTTPVATIRVILRGPDKGLVGIRTKDPDDFIHGQKALDWLKGLGK